MKALSLIGNGLILSLMLSSVAHADDLKIAFAHLERAINEVEEGVKAKADLKKEFEQKQALLDQKQKEAKDLSEAAEKQSAVMKPEAKQAKIMEVQKKIAEVQQLYASMNQDMMKRQNEVMGTIMQKMNAVLAQMGSESGYTAILNKSETGLLWGKAQLDVTNELIRRYDAAYGVKGAKSKKS